MLIVECTGIKSLLPQVTIETVFLVEIGGVTTVQVMQAPRGARFRFRDDNQVNVVRHQAIRVDSNPVQL